MKALAFLFLCVFALNLSAQSILTADGLAAFSATNAAAGGGGGGGSFAFITNSVGVVSGAATATTAAKNATGAKLITVAVQFYTGSPTVSDGNGNTYTRRSRGGDTSAVYTNDLWDCISPTGSLSAHTVSVSGAQYVRVDVIYWSDSGTPTFIAQSSYTHPNGENDTTFQTSGVTPNANSELIIASAVYNNAATASVDSSLALIAQGQELSDPMRGCEFYLIQSTAAFINPTITMSGTVNAGGMTLGVWKP